MEYKRIGNMDCGISAIGQGTMGVGGYFTKDSTRDDFFVDMLREGINLGMTFIDTAEAYGTGHSEELVGRAVNKQRDRVFIASKVSPENLTYDGVIKSLEGSLDRMRTEYVDLYQIHWPNPTVPLDETFNAMEKLVRDGKVRYVGVSNFSIKELMIAVEVFADRIASIQVEYNLFDRTIEEDILPFCEKNNITVIAFSPLDQGRICEADKLLKLTDIGRQYDRTPSQVALRWLISREPVVAIPKATSINHIKENASSLDFDLEEKDVEFINEFFMQRPVSIPAYRIRVDRNGLDKFVPGPEALAKSILDDGVTLKPIRVVKSKDTSDRYDYDLVDGKVRYWAWVFALGEKSLIKALLR
jgi:aryl-alcohol dehydrogenase-like predicted oxidoreductase